MNKHVRIPTLRNIEFDSINFELNQYFGNPVLNFPSVLDSSKTANNPVITNTGLWITPQKYVTLSTYWSQTSYYCTELHIWLFHISGTIGEFIGIGLKAYTVSTRYITVSGEQSGSYQNCVFRLGSLSFTPGTIQHGWNLVSFEMCTDRFRGNICGKTSCAGYFSSTYSNDGVLQGTETQYIGCLNCAGSDISYVIQSVRSTMTSTTCIPSPISSALSNEFTLNTCGNKLRETGEECDDGDIINVDGCNYLCQIESGWTCTGGSTSTIDTCSETCRDSKRFNILTTYCDDGNTSNSDGCSSTCSVETGWTCTGGSSTTKDTCSEICGDSKRFNTLSTKCDDGNTANNDGCSSTCNVETCQTCTGGSSITKDTCSEIYGDSKRFNTLSTKCDDGNTSNTDGCNSTCSVETGWTCTGGSSTTKDTCLEICGDGIKFNTLSSKCDDGNLINGDGCNSSCYVETGWICTGGNSYSAYICTEICGDGKKFSSLSTKCDDGNTVSGDGCSSACNDESGWGCSGGTTSSKDKCVFYCGNGVTQFQNQEQCDDGNLVSGDGCSSKCTIEPKFYCVVLPNLHDISYCDYICGNGKMDAGEECDDGNRGSNDGCDSSCKVELGFKCDTSLANKPSRCYPLCGNGVIDNSPFVEVCDDGNSFDLDGCSAKCIVEKNYDCVHNSSGPDTCKSIYSPPSIKNSTFDVTSLQIVVEFDQVMLNQNITLFDMDLNILGPNSPYVSSWTSKYDKNKLIITFSSSPPLLGGIGEEIILLLYNVNVFKNEHEIPMKAPTQLKFNVGAMSASASVQSGGSGASYTFVFALLLSVGISLFTGGSIELMWSMANSLQILFFYMYLDLHFTPELLTVFSYMKFSNFDNPAFEYIREKTFKILESIKIVAFSPSQVLGLSSSSIIINFMDKLMIIFLFVSFIALIAILSYCLKDKSNKFANFIKKKDIEIRYEGISRFYVEIIMGLSFVVFVNLTYGEINDTFWIVSYSLAGLFLVSVFCVILYCFIYPTIYYSDILVYPDHHERHCLLFLEFNKNKLRNLHFYGYFFIHRLSTSFLIICLNAFIAHQCILLIALNLMMLVYTFKVYNSCLHNFIHSFNCFILLAISCTMPLFLSSSDENKLTMSGYICTGLILVFFLTNWCVVIPSVLKQAYVKIKECCTKSKPEDKKPSNIKHTNRFETHQVNAEDWNNVVIKRYRPRNIHDDRCFANIVEESKNNQMDFYYADKLRKIDKP